MKSIAETCEFAIIQEQLRQFTRTEIGQASVLDLKPHENAFSLREDLATLDEAMHLYTSHGPFPFISSTRLEELLNFAHKGGTLTPRDFDAILHDIINVEKTLAFLKNAVGDFPRLRDMAKDFLSLSSLKGAIQGVITPSLGIYDHASTSLKRIRLRLSKAESDIKARIASMADQYRDRLSDGGYTLRNGHYVLPFKSGEKNKIAGIVHDVSDSGQTVFIEPNAIVELNNTILILNQEEEEEIKRILRELTVIVLNSEAGILQNNVLLGAFDFWQAKAILAHEQDSYIAKVVEDQRIISLTGARHPLIDPHHVVKNDFELNEQGRILILTGPNAGGKTVAMKCVGLLLYMHQCGLAIPTDRPGAISFFDQLLCDIGDQQSIADQLSTFSAHMEGVAEILRHLTPHSFAILDEIGTGTDPQEGEALAVAILHAIARSGAFAVVSSHFSGVKRLAFEEEAMVNGSMLFDEVELRPTYRLRLGLPGESYALEVAKRHGLPSPLLDEARVYLSQATRDPLSSSLSKLTRKIEEQEKINQALAQKQAELAAKEAEIEAFRHELNKHREAQMAKVEQEINNRLQETEAIVQDVLTRLKDENLKWHEAVEIKAKLDHLQEKSDEDEEIPFMDQELKIDDYVMVDDGPVQGRIIRQNGNRLTLITSEGLTIQTQRHRCHKLRTPPRSQHIKVASKGDPALRPALKTELLLLGKRVEEALEEVSKYLDEARLRHLKTVRIIHGSGTGALRQAVHQYLKGLSFVESYRLGNGNEGGVGATVVTLK